MPTFRAPVLGLSHSQAIARAYASAPEDALVLETLEFRHATFVDGEGQPYAIRVVNDHTALLAYLEADAVLNGGEEVRFDPCRFTFEPPAQTESGQAPTIQIVVNNVARQLSPYMAQAKNSRSPLIVTWRPYLPDDLTAPHMSPPLTMSMRDVQVSMNDVQGTGTFIQLINRRFPAKEYTLRKFKNLTVR